MVEKHIRVNKPKPRLWLQEYNVTTQKAQECSTEKNRQTGSSVVTGKKKHQKQERIKENWHWSEHDIVNLINEKRYKTEEHAF